MQNLTEEFARQIVGTFGQDGDQWLRRLPSILEVLSQCWSLTLLPPFPKLSYNYVSLAIRMDGSEAVLKIGVPNKELFTEIEALRIINGKGVVQIYESDHELGAMLLEHLRPGTPLFEIEKDELSTSIAAQVMPKLWQPVPEKHLFLKVSDWARGFQRLRKQFNGGMGPFPKDLVQAAEKMFDELLGSMANPVLLHGDLHHWNILSAEREPWLAIDPKGVIGEPEYEVGAWLRNPFPHILRFTNPEKVIARRVEQFSELLGFDKKRLHGWGFAQAVLAGWWSFEEHSDDWQAWIACACILAELI